MLNQMLIDDLTALYNNPNCPESQRRKAKRRVEELKKFNKSECEREINILMEKDINLETKKEFSKLISLYGKSNVINAFAKHKERVYEWYSFDYVYNNPDKELIFYGIFNKEKEYVPNSIFFIVNNCKLVLIPMEE